MKKYVTEKQQNECIETIQTLISYPSYLREETTDGTPFGQDIVDVLDKMLAICKEMGMSTFRDPEGYYGYAEYGEGKEMLAVLCHLDVVPPGNLEKWETEPFKGEVRDGFLVGRGSQDDKGPAMAALYGFKALLDNDVNFNKRVRFIFGTDEENLWRCMDKYNEKEEKATMGFAPDAEFPLTYAEKGLLQVKLKGAGDATLALNCGGALNVVPGEAAYEGIDLEAVIKNLKAANFEYEEKNNGVTVLGKAIHSKDANQGTNALARLAMALAPLTENQAVQFIAKEVKEDAKAIGIFGELSDQMSGVLTFNVASLKVTAEESEIGIDIRIPVSADKEEVVAKLTALAQAYDLTYEEFDYLASLYVPLDSPLVKTLLAVYQEKTGDMSEPMSSGGATFARTMENCVAFGAVMPDSPITFHQENEKMSLRDIFGAMDIYAESIYRLCCE
ncbi:M20 family metallopeptidase [Isobaculum melis]|uniref:Dipeptidase, putative n=1 Tax=Isobaculum melis TaxID=142588 RepID=A0A1H9S3W6_9LACT|nr:M20 family metallopeptidase [Isobaculum melis]SER79712.1 dipeptidase, putative [Isobaculum melis]